MATTVLSGRESVEDLIARQWVPFDVKDKGAAKPEHYVDAFSQNLVSVFGNGPEVHGIQGHLASYKQLYENLCYVRRDMHHYDVVGDKIYIEYTCVMILASDPEQLVISLRCCNVLKVATAGKDKDLIVRVHGFYDVGPAFDRLFQLGEEVSDEPFY